MLTVAYASIAEFKTAFDAEISKGGLLVRGAELKGAQSGAEVSLTVTVAGGDPVEVPARVAAVVPAVGVAVMFTGVPAALRDLLEEAPKGSLADRLKAMTVPEKMQLALSGGRDERAALLRDNLKTVHVFVLKNPRIGLDEIQAAAKSPQLAPDALKMIAEHREWSGNPTVASGLVQNPKTPLPMALKQLDKIPNADLRMLAKGGAREQLVHAARKKVIG